MALVRVNAEGTLPAAAAPQDGPLRDQIARALDRLAPGAPVVALLHGFRFAPGSARDCPHNHILSPAPRADCWKAVSWPRHLGFVRAGPAEGLALAFGWQARGSLWRAYAEAGSAGVALAELVAMVRALDPSRPVDLFAHSLGARVALCALPALCPGDIGRAILMTAAELEPRAARAMDTPAGRAAEVINVTSRENDLFDLSVEMALAGGLSPALGHGLRTGRPNWLDLQIDDAGTLAALAGLGHRIAAPELKVCHWSPYLRPGLFALYRALLRDRLPLATLRTALPGAQAPRWSRLVQRRGWEAGLRLPGNAPS